jgi:hypothetical protein
LNAGVGSDNSQWIQVSLVFQTLQQMRDKTPLSLNTPPGEVKLTLAGCEERNAQGMCSLAGFTQIRMKHAYRRAVCNDKKEHSAT